VYTIAFNLLRFIYQNDPQRTRFYVGGIFHVPSVGTVVDL